MKKGDDLMAVEENKMIINRMFDEIFHQGKLTNADDLGMFRQLGLLPGQTG
jgi:hypothetical protein